VITFVVWKWVSARYRVPYGDEHVVGMMHQLRAAYPKPHRFICITDEPVEGVECFPIWKDLADMPNPCSPPGTTHLPSCYRRLKIFDPAVTRAMGIEDGAPVCSMDLDNLLVGPIDGLMEMEPEADFCGWHGIGVWKKSVYCGAVWRFRAGRLPWLWSEFDPATSPQRCNEERYFGTDQAWLSLRLMGKYPGWTPDEHGVLSYVVNLRGAHYGTGGMLPGHARIVCFNGPRKPWHPEAWREAPWVKSFWPPRERSLPA